jgi:hypothetical protein
MPRPGTKNGSVPLSPSALPEKPHCDGLFGGETYHLTSGPLFHLSSQSNKSEEGIRSDSKFVKGVHDSIPESRGNENRGS